MNDDNGMDDFDIYGGYDSYKSEEDIDIDEIDFDKLSLVDEDNPLSDYHNDVPGDVLQWKYTSCKYNIEKSTGFFTFSKSEKLTEEEKNELVDKVAHYDPLESLPKRPTQDELKRFPVAFSYFRLSSGKAVICRTQYVGKDYASSRYGNFFSHALILKKGDWDDPLCYYNSSTFSRGLTRFEVAFGGWASLGSVPAPLRELDIEEVKRDISFDDLSKIGSNWFNILKRFIDGFYNALKNGSNLVVYLDEGDIRKYAASLLAAFLNALPANIRRNVGFSTYVRDPSYESLLNSDKEYCFIAFAPSTSNEVNLAGKYVSIDLSNLSTLSKQEYKAKCIYARRLTCDFLKNVVSIYPNDVFTLSSQSLCEIRKKDFLYLDNVGYIDELLQGVVSNIDSIKDMWGFLWGLFLKDDYVNSVQNFVSAVLKNNYLELPFEWDIVRILIRDLLAFSVRVIDGLVERTVDEEFRRKEIRNVCSFWRRHIPQKEDEKAKWRACVLSEIESVFGNESSVASVCLEKSGSSGAGKVSAKEYLETFLCMPSEDEVDQFLTLALGFRVAIDEPRYRYSTESFIDNLRAHRYSSESFIDNLRALYQKLSKRDPNSSKTNPWRKIIELDFFEMFATKIIKPDTYDIIIRVIDYKSLKSFIKRKLTECPKYWRIGKGVPKADIFSSPSSYNNVNDEKESSESESQLVFVDASVKTPKSKKIQQSKSLSEAPQLYRSPQKAKTRFPGADALVLWLVNHHRAEMFLSLLEEDNLFGTFFPASEWDYKSYKDFRRLRAYFETNYKDCFKESNWDDLELYWYDDVIEWRKKLLRWVIRGGLLIVLTVILVMFREQICDFTKEKWMQVSKIVQNLMQK